MMRLPTIVATVTAIGLGTAAQAATVAYSFTATQTDAVLTGGSISVARQAASFDAITGTITFSDERLPDDPGSDAVFFVGPTILIDGLDLSGVTQPSTTEVLINIVNDIGQEEDVVEASHPSLFSLDNSVMVSFQGANPLEDGSLPGPDDFQAFVASGVSSLAVVSGGFDEFVEFELTSITPNFATDPAPVPLPASALMLLAAITGLGAMRGRRTA